MANITAEHLHHMAKRHHATMQKVVLIQERVAGVVQRSTGTLETGAGAWLGGLLEGRTGGQSLGPVPLNLAAGLAMVAVGHVAGAAKDGPLGSMSPMADHLNNLGNGLIGSYLAGAGYAFGKRWKETGKAFGGGGRPWTHPYENGWPKGAPAAPPQPTNGAPPQASGWYDIR